MNEINKTVILCFSGFVLILSTVLVGICVIKPAQYQAYGSAWIEVNSTNSCSSLLLLNENLESKYRTLMNDDLNHIRTHIHDKMESMKCT